MFIRYLLPPNDEMPFTLFRGPSVYYGAVCSIPVRPVDATLPFDAQLKRPQSTGYSTKQSTCGQEANGGGTPALTPNSSAASLATRKEKEPTLDEMGLLPRERASVSHQACWLPELGMASINRATSSGSSSWTKC
jgi:hypothetical protein